MTAAVALVWSGALARSSVTTRPADAMAVNGNSIGPG
jgi:hypothetical protein